MIDELTGFNYFLYLEKTMHSKSKEKMKNPLLSLF